MAVPTSYTETKLKEYMHAELGPIATDLGWTVANGAYNELLNDTLVAYGMDATDDTAVEAVAGTDNLHKLRLLSKVMMWRQVFAHTSGDFDFSADGATYNREQVNKMARAVLSSLEVLASAYLPGFAVTTQKVEELHDPYEYRDYTKRVL